MESAYYIPRKLKNSDKQYTEESLLEASHYIVILAEPGGGKTALLESLANKLGVAAVTANVFRHVGTTANECPLVIDAFDELAKIDQTGIHVLLANAKKANPTYLIISSRSSEWGNASTSAFKASSASPLFWLGSLSSMIRNSEPSLTIMFLAKIFHSSGLNLLAST